MTEKERVEQLLIEGEKAKLPRDEWIVALLSSIAYSLAVIADRINRKEQE